MNVIDKRSEIFVRFNSIVLDNKTDSSLGNERGLRFVFQNYWI